MTLREVVVETNSRHQRTLKRSLDTNFDESGEEVMITRSRKKVAAIRRNNKVVAVGRVNSAIALDREPNVIPIRGKKEV
jgi:hypothetical protein